VLARDRVLSARGLDEIMRSLEKVQVQLAESPDDAAVLERYGRLEERLHGAGRLRRRGEAARICSNLGLPERALGPAARHPVRRAAAPHRAGPHPVLRRDDAAARRADQPPRRRLDHLAARLPGQARRRLIVISHDVELLDAVVNKVFHLDANRAALDQYNVGWKTYLAQRETDEKRRKRERLNAEKQAGVLNAQAEKMRAKATKAKAAQGMFKRAEKLLAGVEGERVQDRVAKLRFPEPAPCGRTPADRAGPVEVVRLARDLHGRRPGDRPGRARRRPGLNGAARRRCCGCCPAPSRPTPARCCPGTACAGLLRAGARHARHRPHGAREHALEQPDLAETEARRVLGSFLFSGDVVHQPAARCPAARRPGWRSRPSS
jgi:ATPase subunit of ABC transporter with duplicated ATPase domains